MASIISGKITEKCLRQLLRAEGYSLSRQREHGETGVDIIARKGNEKLYIEVISFKSSPPARSKDFYQVFFRVISRLNQNAKSCIIALPERFQLGLPNRVRQYREGWTRIGRAFPELEIWLIDVHKKRYKRTKWLDWLEDDNKGKPIMLYGRNQRVWLVEDNMVALYIALYGYDGLIYDLNEIKSIIQHKGFSMRIKNFKAIKTNGKDGLTAGLKSPLLKKTFNIFSSFDQKKFSDLINTILETKKNVQCKTF